MLSFSLLSLLKQPRTPMRQHRGFFMPTESILLSYQSTTQYIKRYYTGYTKYYTEYYTDTTQSTNRVLTKNLLRYY